MVGKSRYCEICGVREIQRGGFFASFPIDESRCKAWVKLVGKEDLVHVPIEKLHEVRHVCGDHFEKRDFGKTGNKLKKRASPKLNLSAPPLSDHQLRAFPQHVASKLGSSLAVQQVTLEPTPSTSREPLSTSIKNLNAPVEVKAVKRPDETAENEAKRHKINHAGDVPTPVEAKTVTRPDETAENEAKRHKINDAGDVLISAADPIIPVEEQLGSFEPTPSTSREPLSTSVIQNLNAPVPTKRPGIANELLGSSTAVVIDSERHKTDQANPNTDCNTKKDELIRQLKGLKATIRSLKATIRSLKKNARLMEDLESPLLKEIVTLALQNQKRKPRGYRWTPKYKISCLAILKRSPKAYKYLQHLVPLPSVKTLQSILQKVPMEPGISMQILEHLRKTSALYIKDKYCCLLFDEIAIKPRLNFNSRSDKVDGYTDMGKSERSNSLADDALVFMLQGIRKKFKQPVAFYFVKGTVSSQKLAAIVMEIIGAVNETGYQVLATVCDQGPTNMGALKILRDYSPTEEGPSMKNYFNVGSKKIFMIYDVPHLFKSIRNNFMNYGIIKMDGKMAKWEHMKKVEERNRNLLYLSKITPNHIQPKNRAKMKVKYAAQTLSNTVAAVLKLLALAEESPNTRQEINQSGEIVHNLDQLFDCTNGPSGPEDVKKGQRENVSTKTNHVNAWAHYRKMLETVTFVNKDNGKQAKNVRCIQGYLTTLCSLRDIWSEVQRLGFKYLNLRQLNQDSLENLFGVIRQHSPTNRNPTVTAFVAALKTTIINRMSAPHSRGSNCQKDSNLILTDLHNLVFDPISTSKLCRTVEKKRHDDTEEDNNKENKDSEYFTLHIPDDYEDETVTKLLTVEGQPIVYISGYLASSILKKHNCPICEKCLTTVNLDDDTFLYIKLREWWADKSSLTYPHINVCKYVENCVEIFENEIIPILHENNISSQTVTLFMANWDSSFIKCHEHRSNIFNVLSVRLAMLLIRRQCERINTKLSAQEEDLADKNKKAQQQGMAR